MRLVVKNPAPGQSKTTYLSIPFLGIFGFRYSLKKFSKIPLNLIRDSSTKGLQGMDPDLSSILVIKHSKFMKITIEEEIMEYTLQTMISDIGGLVGIFLGISFWSIFDDLIKVIKKTRCSFVTLCAPRKISVSE